MSVTISFFESLPAKVRSEKGKSLLQFPQEFTVIDTEATGYSAEYDEIIEFAAIRVRDGVPVDKMQTLVKPFDSVDGYIEQLTGITNDMLRDAPTPTEVLPAILDFLGDDILVGHNVNFDINFLYDYAEKYLGRTVNNDFVDTLRLARRLLPELKHHRLCDIAQAFGVAQPISHRSLADCDTTLACFDCLKGKATEKYGSATIFVEKTERDAYRWSHLERITTENTEFDTSHPLYGKRCVFTGALERMTRMQAAQLVVDRGGYADNGITKKTNYLILGNNDYCKSIKDGKSSKQKKAEQYKLDGYDIEIIPESVFYEMLAQE